MRLDHCWDALDSLFGPLSLPQERSRRGRLLSDFRQWGAAVGYNDEQLADLIVAHYRRMSQDGWKPPYLTERSIFNHWSAYEADAPETDSYADISVGATVGSRPCES